jgi:hypothetical protein
MIFLKNVSAPACATCDQACCEHKKKRTVRALKVCGAGSTLGKVIRHDGENTRFEETMLQFMDVI